MSKTSKNVLLIGGIAILLIMLFKSYNGMVNKDEEVEKQWAQVQTAYQRRADLIPNLVSTVKGYAAHEQTTLTAVIEARSNATKININADQLTADNLKKYQEAQGMIGAALGRLLRVQEAYPDLKANANFMALQDELAGTENRISVQRQRFNEAVQAYNSTIRRFPNNLLASMFGFDKKAYFEADQAAQTAPKVEF